MIKKTAKIYIAGHKGLLGSALLEEFSRQSYENLIFKSRAELDLTRQGQVEDFFKTRQPEIVIMAAAKVGGIHANSAYPADFLYENLLIESNIIHSSYLNGAKKLLFFGSACSYPRECPQPAKEEYLLTGALEPTNEAYAIAKIAGIKMCASYNKQYGTNFISVIPANMYGPGDNFNPEASHVIPAMIRKFHEAKINQEPSVVVWGTGRPLRDFIYVDDVVNACLFLLKVYNGSGIINIGSSSEISIREIAFMAKEVTGYSGDIIFDTAKPDGMPRKVLDAAKIRKLGWQAKTPLKEGIAKTYAWYLHVCEENFVS